MSTNAATKKNHAAAGYLFYGIAATIWGINGTVSKVIIMAFDDPGRVLQVRIGFAAVILAIYVALKNPKAFKLSRQEIPMLVLYALPGLTLCQWSYFVAISKLPVGIALLIEFTAPIFIVLWVRYGRKQYVKSTVWLGLLLAISGLAFVAQVWKGFTLDPTGLAVSLVSMVSLIFYFLFGEKAGSVRDSASLMMWGFLISSLFWAIYRPWTSFPWHNLNLMIQPFEGSTSTMHIGWFVAYMVLGGTVFPFVLVMKAIQHLGAAGASLMGMFEPLIAFIVAWVVLGEALNLIQIIGGLAMLLGVYIAEMARTSSGSEAEKLETLAPS